MACFQNSGSLGKSLPNYVVFKKYKWMKGSACWNLGKNRHTHSQVYFKIKHKEQPYQ